MNKKRRAELQKVIETLSGAASDIRDIQMEEQDAYDALSEHFMETERCETMQDAIDAMEDAIDEIESAQELLEDL